MLTRPEIIVAPDCPTVKFSEPMEKINLDLEMPKILENQGWGLGTVFNVQFINHEKTELIKTARFIVFLDDETLRTFNPDGQQPMTKTVFVRKAKQIESWFYPGEDVVETKGSVNSGIIIKWHPGLKVHQVIQNDKVIFQDADKVQAQAFKDAA